MIGVAELFKIGIGPSSSHTVGPMKAAFGFVEDLKAAGRLGSVSRVRADLFGSLAWTGKGHGTDKAVLLGLAGFEPVSIDPDKADAAAALVRTENTLHLGGIHTIPFNDISDIVFDGITETPQHPNTLAFTAFNGQGEVVASERWCSIGGGFVVREEMVGQAAPVSHDIPLPFRSGKELLALCETHGLSIAEVVRTNEQAHATTAEVDATIDKLTGVMMACIDRGLRTEGELPGGLKVQRRAKGIYDRLTSDQLGNQRTPHEIMDWVSLYAMAVNEENAVGGRVVTAPTNGAAGVVPATIRYYLDHCAAADQAGVRTFMLTATAIGGLFKLNASISGAEVGCQGEVGVASSMAAAGLAAALGGTPGQVENAAEIAMEHHLGMTCDPVGGLVQIPCIERNAFGAVAAINAASLALHGDGTHRVSLDQVVNTMRQTGADMQSKYRETSLGGLAVNFVEC